MSVINLRTSEVSTGEQIVSLNNDGNTKEDVEFIIHNDVIYYSYTNIVSSVRKCILGRVELDGTGQIETTLPPTTMRWARLATLNNNIYVIGAADESGTTQQMRCYIYNTSLSLLDNGVIGSAQELYYPYAKVDGDGIFVGASDGSGHVVILGCDLDFTNQQSYVSTTTGVDGVRISLTDVYVIFGYNGLNGLYTNRLAKSDFTATSGSLRSDYGPSLGINLYLNNQSLSFNMNVNDNGLYLIAFYYSSSDGSVEVKVSDTAGFTSDKFARNSMIVDNKCVTALAWQDTGFVNKARHISISVAGTGLVTKDFIIDDGGLYSPYWVKGGISGSTKYLMYAEGIAQGEELKLLIDGGTVTTLGWQRI